MRRLFRALLVVSACLSGAGARAQVPGTPLFRAVDTEDGLPSNTVHRIAQDRDGDLWLATADGLARFDGIGFRVWQNDPLDPASLPANNVLALHIDARGRVWVGSEGGGLSLLRPDLSGFTNFRDDPRRRFALADVWSIASARDGAIWFGGFGGGLHRYRPETDELVVFRHDPQRRGSLASDHVIALATDRDGTLWIGSNVGLDRAVREGFEHAGSGNGLSAAMVMSLKPDADGSLWIGTRGGLDRRHPDGRIERDPLALESSGASATDLMHDSHGSRWIATHQGLRYWTPEGLRPYNDLSARRHPISRIAVTDGLEDHEGGLWFATLGAGLQRLAPDWRNFSVLVAGDATRGGLSMVAPLASADAPDGGLWVVGNGSVLDHVNAQGEVTRHLESVPGVSGSPMRSVLQTADDAVWIGQLSGLVRYDPRRGQTRRWANDSPQDAVLPGSIDLLARAPDGTLWLSARGSGLQQRSADGTVLSTWAAGVESGLVDADIEDMRFGPDGSLWLAGSGLLRLIPGSARFERVAGAPDTRIYGFDFDTAGELWLQRLGALERFRVGPRALELAERIDQQRGMPAVEAGGVRVDLAGDVWVTSLRGLLRFRRASGELQSFGVQDGLPSSEFADRPPLRTRSGAIVAGTVEGLVWFDPLRLQQQRHVPRVRFESISLRRDGAQLSIEPRDAVAISHEDRELRVSARLLSFANPQSHRYRFRMRGYDRDWIDVGNRGERVFSQLPAGHYALEVVAAGADGVWSAPPLKLAVTVASPWWSTPHAIAGMAVALSLLVLLAALISRRRLRLRLVAQLVQQQHAWTLSSSEAKSSFLATLGHEIRTPMTGVLGMTELLLKTPLAGHQRDYAESIQRSGDLLLRLVDDALDLSCIEAGRFELQREPMDLQALLRDVYTFQRPLAMRKQLALSLKIDPAAPRWVRGDALRLKQVLLNLVGNAVKFTEQGEVEILLQPADAPYSLAITVRDTGPGLDAEQQARLFRRFSQADGAQTARRYGGSGLGLAISQELAAAMEGRIEIESAVGSGSRFIVRLPLAPCETETGTDAPTEAPVAPVSVPQGGRRRILLVEDDVTVAAVVCGLLAAQGHAVTHALHGLAALAELDAAVFDLAFLDLDLPGIDGFELARLMRMQGHGFPFVALTARADPEAEGLAHAAGMNGFLRKPVNSRQLAQAIEDHLTADDAVAV